MRKIRAIIRALIVIGTEGFLPRMAAVAEWTAAVRAARRVRSQTARYHLPGRPETPSRPEMSGAPRQTTPREDRNARGAYRFPSPCFWPRAFA